MSAYAYSDPAKGAIYERYSPLHQQLCQASSLIYKNGKRDAVAQERYNLLYRALRTARSREVSALTRAAGIAAGTKYRLVGESCSIHSCGKWYRGSIVAVGKTTVTVQATYGNGRVFNKKVRIDSGFVSD